MQARFRVRQLRVAVLVDIQGGRVLRTVLWLCGCSGRPSDSILEHTDTDGGSDGPWLRHQSARRVRHVDARRGQLQLTGAIPRGSASLLPLESRHARLQSTRPWERGLWTDQPPCLSPNIIKSINLCGMRTYGDFLATLYVHVGLCIFLRNSL